MFRFTIRELLLLTVIAGLAVGWWIDRAALLTAAKLHLDAATAAGEEAYVLEQIMFVSGFELDRNIPGRITVSAPDGDHRNWPARMKRPAKSQ